MLLFQNVVNKKIVFRNIVVWHRTKPQEGLFNYVLVNNETVRLAQHVNVHEHIWHVYFHTMEVDSLLDLWAFWTWETRLGKGLGANAVRPSTLQVVTHETWVWQLYTRHGALISWMNICLHDVLKCNVCVIVIQNIYYALCNNNNNEVHVFKRFHFKYLKPIMTFNWTQCIKY